MSDRRISSPQEIEQTAGRQRPPVGPYHEFFVLEDTTHPQSEYMKWGLASGSLQVADDIIDYLYDSLQWIPTVNPANPAGWAGHGVNRWGPTIIHRTGATTARQVFSAWADLFSAGPPELTLRGAWTTWPDGAQDYQTLVVPREGLVEQMRGLAGYADRCIRGDFYMLHIGV